MLTNHHIIVQNKFNAKPKNVSKNILKNIPKIKNNILKKLE